MAALRKENKQLQKATEIAKKQVTRAYAQSLKGPKLTRCATAENFSYNSHGFKRKTNSISPIKAAAPEPRSSLKGPIQHSKNVKSVTFDMG